MTLVELLKKGEADLKQANVPEAGLNAWYLLSFVTGMSRGDYYLKSAEDASQWQSRYEDVLRQRMERKPLEYITHETEFMGLPFYVDEHVLIPRQDTECLVEEILPLVRKKDVLDLCTGSGCIGVSLGVLGECRSVTLADLSEEALQVAGKNAKKNEAKVSLIQGDLFENIVDKFYVIVSNPPYIATNEIPALMPEVREFEPKMALDGMQDGLYFYRRIIHESLGFLQYGGWLCFEIGYDQAKPVGKLMQEKGFCNVMIKKDLAGLDRIVLGRRMEDENVR